MNFPTIWGMIHVPRFRTKSMQETVDFCLIDAKIYFEHGINHFFIENFGNSPFPKSHVKPHIIAGMTHIIDEIKYIYPKSQIGVNVLRNDALSALAIASMTNCSAIRVNILTHARLTDQGIIEGCSYDLANYKEQLNSSVEIWADIEVKHSYPLATISTEESIQDTLGRGGADKIIFTGQRTGLEPDFTKIKDLVTKTIVSRDKVVIGSGISEQNLTRYLPYANNFIVGTNLKEKNIISNHVDAEKVSRLVTKSQKEIN